MSEAFVDQIINNALATVATYTTSATNAADALIASNAGIYIEPPSSSPGFTFSAEEPEIPEANDSLQTYESERDALIALLSGQLADFFNTYYPLANDAFDEATAWLVDTITNGGTGINADIEDQVWQRARERIVADGKRVEYQITVGYAAKGIMLPAGSMTKKIEESRFDQTSKTSALSTDIADKQLAREIDTIKFAISTAMSSRQMAMQAAADYIRSIASAPDTAARLAGLNTDIKARMMSAAADFYRSRQGRDQIVLQSKLAQLDASIDIYKHRRTNATENSRVDVQALASAADVFGRAVSAALSSLNSVASSSVNSFG